MMSLKAFKVLRQLVQGDTEKGMLVPLKEDTVSARIGEMYGMNKWVRIKDHEVCVMGVEDRLVKPFRIDFGGKKRQEGPTIVLDDGREILPPPDPDDPRVLFVNVAYRNPHRTKALDCRRNQWWLYDAEGYSYEVQGSNRFLYEDNEKPFLGGQRYLAPRLMLRGWLAFEIGRGVMPAYLQFVDGFLSGNTVEFLLEMPPPLTDGG